MLRLRRLLVVDDQRLDRAIAGHAASQAGFQVTGVGSVGETRDQLESGAHFDFVVVDLSLGTEDGLEVLPLIARFNSSAVVVLVSGFDGRILAASQQPRLKPGIAGCGGTAQAGPARRVATSAAPGA